MEIPLRADVGEKIVAASALTGSVGRGKVLVFTNIGRVFEIKDDFGVLMLSDGKTMMRLVKNETINGV